MLYGYGFWAHNLKQDNSGQPADVIAVRNKVAYLIDAKDCEKDYFLLSRIEENQDLAMTLWGEVGNGDGWFAIRTKGEVYMVAYSILSNLRKTLKRLSYDDIHNIGYEFGEWVMLVK